MSEKSLFVKPFSLHLFSYLSSLDLPLSSQNSSCSSELSLIYSEFVGKGCIGYEDTDISRPLGTTPSVIALEPTLASHIPHVSE
ncbi:hypothetical protein DNTS_029825 [Danionella cerebrum]|uniref:Uncharacterized protein n=1 Tax=Danionella cerebrum TaxID=2873325 RepID=A0A553QRD8_9TELE|nr:hypothetical protein DNTS_029825 [Danionella translucida]